VAEKYEGERVISCAWVGGEKRTARKNAGEMQVVPLSLSSVAVLNLNPAILETIAGTGWR
jgi:hypothetical protein